MILFIIYTIISMTWDSLHHKACEVYIWSKDTSPLFHWLALFIQKQDTCTFKHCERNKPKGNAVHLEIKLTD